VFPGQRPHGLSLRLEALARTITRVTGSTTGFALALGTIVVWGVTGPLFYFSDTWQQSHSVDEATTRHAMNDGRKNTKVQ